MTSNQRQNQNLHRRKNTNSAHNKSNNNNNSNRNKNQLKSKSLTKQTQSSSSADCINTNTNAKVEAEAVSVSKAEEAVYHSSAWSKSFMLLCFLITIAMNDLHFNFPSFFGSKPADTKPYKTVDDFYPFYLTQHSDKTCRLCHVCGTTVIVLMGLCSPESVISAMIGILTAYLSFPLFRGYPNGIFEAIIMAVVTGSMAVYHKCWKVVLLAGIIAYSFAWVGHFVFEKNNPATYEK